MSDIKHFLQAKSGAKSDLARAKAAYELGDTYFWRKKYKEAIAEYREAAQVFLEKEGQELTVAKLYRRIGDAKVDTGAYEEALDDYGTYLRMARDKSDQVEEQRALISLARCQLMLGDKKSADEGGSGGKSNYRLADKFCRKALEAIPERSSGLLPVYEWVDMRLNHWRQQSDIFLRLGRLSDARKSCADALSFAEKEQGSPDSEVVALLNLQTTVLMCEGALENAFRTNAKALAVVRSSSKIEGSDLLYLSLMLKSKIMICLKQFSEGRKFMKELFKDDALPSEDCLKFAIHLVRLAKKIIASSSSSVGKKSKYLEKTGDTLIKLYEVEKTAEDVAFLRVSNDYYLEAVSADPNADPKRLSALYQSIAMNYEDLRDHARAKEYFSKTLDIRRDDNRKAAKLTLKIARCAEMSGEVSKRVLNYYDQAKKLAIRGNATELEAKALRGIHRHHQNHRDPGTEAVQSESEYLRFLDQYGLKESTLDEDASDSDCSDDSGDDSSLQDPLELDLNIWSDSDEDSCGGRGAVAPGVSRKRKPKCTVSTNKFGETKLHELCKEEGNLDRIRLLIKNGHPVGQRDFTGFTAMHEACNFGYLEYVTELKNAGCSLNTQSNEGVTPLITASANGKLEVVKFLLDSGATMQIQDKWGWTAFDHLKHTATESEERSSETIEILRKMKMELSKHKLLPKQPMSFAFMSDESDTLTTSRSSKRSRNNERKDEKPDNRKTIDVGQSPKKTRAVDDYVNTLSSLGGSKGSDNSGSRGSKSGSKFGISVKSKGGSDDESNWLEDDVGMFKDKLKRKRTSLATSSKPKVRRESSVTAPFSKRPRMVSENEEEDPKDQPVDFIEVDDDVAPTIEEEPSPPPSKNANEAVKDTTKKAMTSSSRYRCIVGVEGKKLRVPIDKDKKVKDLIEEIAARYTSSKLERKPTFQLMDDQDCELDPGDALEDIFGETADPKITAIVENWALMPALSLYTQNCNKEGFNPMQGVMEALKSIENSNIVNFSRSLLGESHEGLPLVFRSLKFRESVTDLLLSNNRLGLSSCPRWRAEFTEALTTMKRLKVLDLSRNGIDHIILSGIVDLFAESDRKLTSLKVLDLSYNLLDDLTDSVMMSLLSNMPNLKTLRLQGCDLSRNFLVSITSAEVSQITELDLSLNPNLGSTSISSILQAINPKILTSLNISGSICCGGGSDVWKSLLEFVRRGRSETALKVLKAAQIPIIESSWMDDLFYYLTNLKELDLSYTGLDVQAVISLTTGLYSQSLNVIKLHLYSNIDLFGSYQADHHREEAFINAIRRLVKERNLQELGLAASSGSVSRGDSFVLNEIEEIWSSEFQSKTRIFNLGMKWTVSSLQ